MKMKTSAATLIASGGWCGFATVESFAGPELVISTPRGLWVALYLYTFVLLFVLVSAIPHLPVVPTKTEGVNS
jgi:hypothetical protein